MAYASVEDQKGFGVLHLQVLGLALNRHWYLRKGKEICFDVLRFSPTVVSSHIDVGAIFSIEKKMAQPSPSCRKGEGLSHLSPKIFSTEPEKTAMLTCKIILCPTHPTQ